jgi:hypothetical protein
MKSVIARQTEELLLGLKLVQTNRAAGVIAIFLVAAALFLAFSGRPVDLFFKFFHGRIDFGRR